MGLLSKANPLATPESVWRHAKIFGVLGGVGFGLFCLWRPAVREFWLIGVPLAAVFGGAIGALIEWQVFDELDILDIVAEIEAEFRIKIPESEWQRFETVDDLFRCVLDHLGSRDAPDSCTTIGPDVWVRFRRMFVRGMGYNADEVLDSSRLCEDLGILTYPKAMEFRQ
jgi:hypothetical protein